MSRSRDATSVAGLLLGLFFFRCCLDGLDHRDEGGHLLLAHAGQSLGFEALQGLSGLAGKPPALAGEAEQIRASVVGMDLAGDQPPVFETVEDFEKLKDPSIIDAF